MTSAENICGRALVDAPAVHWKPLTISSRGGTFNRCESLDAALQNQTALYPDVVNASFLFFERAVESDAIGKDHDSPELRTNRYTYSRRGGSAFLSIQSQSPNLATP